MSKGLKILKKQLNEQILEDGGHFELSTMYHGLILEDILDLINLGVSYSNSLNKSQRSFFLNLKILATRMLYWHEKMHHPDNKISFFNDATFEISSDYIKLNQIAKKLGIKNKKGDKNFNFLRKVVILGLINGQLYLLVMLEGLDHHICQVMPMQTL